MVPTGDSTLLTSTGPVLVIFLIIWSVACPARAQDASCDDALNRAQTLYFEGRFDESLTLLQACLRQGAFPDDEQQRDVYLLIGRTNYAKGLEEEARDALRALLSIVPSYSPDPTQFPPSFIELVEEVRREMEQDTGPVQPAEPQVAQQSERRGGPTKWLLIGGGAIATGVLVAVLAGGGGNGGNGGTDVLVGPPSLP